MSMTRQENLYRLGAAFLLMVIAKKRRIEQAIQEQEQEKQIRRRRARKSFWICPFLRLGKEYGAYYTLMVEFEQNDLKKYINFLRMSPEMFQELLDMCRPHLQKHTTNFREPLPPGLKLAVTLRFLATGMSYVSLMYLFRVAKNTICNFIPHTCHVIWYVLRDYIKLPSTEAEWTEVADLFQKRWNFPNCLGAVDGKHCRIRSPAHSGSKFFNYKKSFSIVLMAVVDANYSFLYCNTGAYGRSADGGIWGECDLGADLDHDLDPQFADEARKLPLPPDRPYSGDDQPMPFAFVGDDAFALSRVMQKPFSKRNLTREERIYNYRLSRARRVVENAFGIMANRWRILLTNMCVLPERADKIVNACCVLHNWLRVKRPSYTNSLVDREDPVTHEVIPGEWHDDVALRSLEKMKSRNAKEAAKAQRQYTSQWVNSEAGSVPWQDRMI